MFDEYYQDRESKKTKSMIHKLRDTVEQHKRWDSYKQQILDGRSDEHKILFSNKLAVQFYNY